MIEFQSLYIKLLMTMMIFLLLEASCFKIQELEKTNFQKNEDLSNKEQYYEVNQIHTIQPFNEQTMKKKSNGRPDINFSKQQKYSVQNTDFSEFSDTNFEQTGHNFLLQNKITQRRQLAVVQLNQKAQPSSSNQENSQGSQPSSSNNIKTKFVQSREFEGIGLYDLLPDVLVENENYRFHGIVQNPILFSSSDILRVTVIFIEPQTRTEIRCTKSLKSNQAEFNMSCKIQRPGIYYVTIFSGPNGRTSSKKRQVISLKQLTGLKNSSKSPLASAPVPNNLVLDVIKNDLFIMWDSVAPITKLIITQRNDAQNKSLEFILTNYHTKYTLPYVEFSHFQQSTTIIYISHASSTGNSYYNINSQFSKQISAEIDATQHKFSEYQQKLINHMTDIPYKVDLGYRTRLIGNFNVSLRQDYYIVTPSLKIQKIKVTSQGSPLTSNGSIPPGRNISIQLIFNEPGVYILEINADYGQAVVNRPIYVGNCYPVLPDFKDLREYSFYQKVELFPLLHEYVQSQFQEELNLMAVNERDLIQPSNTSSINERRSFLLKLTNLLRLKYKVQSIYIDQDLNKIAQAHSDDMALRGYFSHTTPQGYGPGERAKKMGFQAHVGQNLAYSPSLTEGHLNLERSAAHLDNSVNDKWTRVGIGITSDNKGGFLLVYKFSGRDLESDPVSKEQLSIYQAQVAALIKNNNPFLSPQDKQLSKILQIWQQGKQGDMYSYLTKNGYYYSMAWNTISVSYATNFIQILQKDTKLLKASSNYKYFGVSILLDEQSAMLQILVVYYSK